MGNLSGTGILDGTGILSGRGILFQSGILVPPSFNPLELEGLIAAYNVENTTRTGNEIDTWQDVTGNGYDAQFTGTKDTVYGSAPNEYAAGGGRYLCDTPIPADFSEMTYVVIYGAGRIAASNAISNSTPLLTNSAAAGGGFLTDAGALQFYNPVRPIGGFRNYSGINSIAAIFSAGATASRSNGITSTGAANDSASVTEFTNIWGYDGGGSFQWNAERIALYVFNRALTANELRSIERYHNVSIPVSTIHVFGDSFANGIGASTGPQAWPRVVELSLNIPTIIAGGNGNTLATFSTTNSPVGVSASVTAGLNTIVVLDLGKNDLAANTSSAALQTIYTTFCNAITATGADLVCVSIPPRNAGFSGGADATSYETERLDFNTWLRGQEGTLFEKLADVGADGRIGDVADLAGANYNGDGIHLSDAGHAIYAEIVETEINSL